MEKIFLGLFFAKIFSFQLGFIDSPKQNNNFYIDINETQIKDTISEQDIEVFFKIINDIFQDYFFNSYSILFLELGLVSPDYFLNTYGQEIWEKIKYKLMVIYNSNIDNKKLIHLIEYTIIDINNLPITFESDVAKREIKTKKTTNQSGKIIEIFENKEYEENWSFIQKFCYRREFRIKGFTQWFKQKLVNFTE